MINFTQTQEEQITKTEILSQDFMSQNMNEADLSQKLKVIIMIKNNLYFYLTIYLFSQKLSLFLSSLKNFGNVDEKDQVREVLMKIPKMRIMKDEDVERDYQIISNLICCFVDFMRILAPQLEFEDDIIKFYLNIFIKWLDNYSNNIFDIPSHLQLKFDYILDRLGKTNMLSLMINVGMESEIQKVIKLLITIQGDKRYTEKTQNFHNMVLIIKGLLEEVRTLTIPLLNDILLNLNKKKINFEQYCLSFQILSEMKNILSAPINQLIFQLTNSESQKEKKVPEILKISGTEFTFLLTTLCKISNEYLINFLSTFPLNDTLKKTKIREATTLEILLAIFSTQNSLLIAKDYLKMFMNFLDALNSKLVKENDKGKIFLCLIKFLSKNNKLEMKKNNLYFIILEKIKIFFEEVKSESTVMIILDALSNKLLKNKKIPTKIINYFQIYLESKNPRLVKVTMDFNFTLLTRKILKVTSLFDLFSNEKKKKINKLSFLFNNLINKYENSPVGMFKSNFNSKLFDVLYLEGLENSQTIILLFFLTLNDHKANVMLHRYFSESLEICSVVLGISNNKEAFDSPKNLSREENVEANPLSHPHDVSRIKRQIEASKGKLEKSSDFVMQIEEVMRIEKGREEILGLLERDITQRGQKIQNFLQNNSALGIEEKVLFKKAFLILVEDREIKSINEFGSLLLNSLDEENLKSYEFLQTILSVMLFYVRFNIAYIIIQDESLNSSSPKSKYFINKNVLDAFTEILDFQKKILKAKVINKDVMAYVTAIIKTFFNLKNELIIENIKSLILNEFSIFCFENYEVSLKDLAVLYFELNKRQMFDEKDFPFLLPEKFEHYLFESDKKLSCLKFINEMLKIDKDNALFNNVIFNEEYQTYILQNLKPQNENLFKDKHKLMIKTSKKTEIRRDLVFLMNIKHEILKYEFYLLFQNVDSKVAHQNFLKMIFNKIYELCNYEEKLQEMDEENDEKVNSTVSTYLKHVNNLNICKYINLVFRHLENGVMISPKHQVKLMNVALFPEIFVRDHLLKKIEKSLSLHTKSSLQTKLHAIPIVTIYFNDPDKSLKKKSNFIFASFISYLVDRYNLCKEMGKNKNSMYKYLPEVYISYILTYFVFNANLNLLFQSKEEKYFESIILTFLKILKKVTNNKFDSHFLIQNCIKIKSQLLKDKKVIKKFSLVTYIKSIIKTENYLVTSDNYEFVKNELCNLIIKIVNSQFITDFRHEDFKPNIPLIFSNSNENEPSFNRLPKEDNISYFNADATLNLSKIEKKENEISIDGITSNLVTKNKSILSTSNVQKSNVAVKNHKLQLEPESKHKVSKGNLQSDEEDFDEFADLPFYNKYKSKEEGGKSVEFDLEEVDENIIPDNESMTGKQKDAKSKKNNKRQNKENVETEVSQKRKKNK